jgi:hypothetical protein
MKRASSYSATVNQHLQITLSSKHAHLQNIDNLSLNISNEYKLIVKLWFHGYLKYNYNVYSINTFISTKVSIQ